MAIPTQPLTNAQVADIQKTIDMLGAVRGSYDKYVACGIDCTDKMALCDYLMQQLQIILDVWVNKSSIAPMTGT